MQSVHLDYTKSYIRVFLVIKQLEKPANDIALMWSHMVRKNVLVYDYFLKY